MEEQAEALSGHSVLFLNKRLVNKGPKIWDEAAIEKQAKRLHKRAVKIWPQTREFWLVLIDAAVVSRLASSFNQAHKDCVARKTKGGRGHKRVHLAE